MLRKGSHKVQQELEQKNLKELGLTLRLQEKIHCRVEGPQASSMAMF